MAGAPTLVFSRALLALAMAALVSLSAPKSAFADADDDACKPRNAFPSSGKASGFGGLAVEYDIQGLPISDYQEWRPTLGGFPKGKEVVVNFKVYGPHSIEGSWATDASISLDGKVVETVRAPDNGGAPGWSYSAKPVVVKITNEVRKSGFTIAANVGYARSSNAEIVMFTVKGKPCANAEEPTSIPWEVVGGGLAAVAAAAALVRSLRRRKHEDTPNKDDKPDGYILQVSANAITMQTGQSSLLEATVWRVEQNGQQIASEATINIAAPADATFLKIAPADGAGRLRALLSLVGEPPSADGVVLQITAEAPDGGKSAEVRLSFQTEEMVVEAIGERDFFQVKQETLCAFVARYDEAQHTWIFGDMVVWFTQPGSDKPVRPNFTPLFDPPVAEPKLQGLKITGPVSDDGLTWRWKVSLKPGAKLDERWLLQDGRMKVTVTCKPGGVSP